MSEPTQQPPQESPETSPESPPPPEAQEQQEAPQEAAPASPESPAPAESEEASDAGEDAAPEQPQKRGRKSGYQRQIERLEREKAQMWEILQRLQPQGQGQPQQPQRQLTPEEQAAQQFEALVDKRLSQRLEAERALAAQAAEASELQRQMAEARSRYADFDEVVDSTPMPPQHVQAAILKSRAKADIMYALSTNQAELARISALPPLDAALEIGRLEAKVASGAAQQKVTPAPRKTAPAPITPVTARGVSNVKPADQMSYEEYKAWRSQAKR